MQYAISFLEGITAFLSPGLLPLMGIYALWWIGGGLRSNKQSLMLGFGYSAGFMGAFFLTAVVQIPGWICGSLLLLLGLLRVGSAEKKLFVLLPGVLGAGLALYWAGNHGFFPERLTSEGVLLLGCFALGVTVPFLFAGVFLDRLKTAVPWLRDHLQETALLSGIALLAAGFIM